eukprot:CAMPEP_0178880234 /NCGR_PEP_ID=MMETSP0747-20121128/12362_1 /TAXON_ID=913974 /ORGANISM="Nitzschia punctata, Strain CCMP561" /LENGTH=525 /DNA_ID=CAMNT_0020548129 /DNA_START=37 /DNA_END=1614 /DNA_ORIENTATION=-
MILSSVLRLLLLLQFCGTNHAFSSKIVSLVQRRNPTISLVKLDTISTDVLQGEGMPSSVGWTSERLNRLTQWADSKKPNRPVVCEYQPDGFWLWRKWKGTVLKSNWTSVVFTMLLAILLHFFVRHGRRLVWPWYAVPPKTDPFIMGLAGVRKAWEFHLTIATFILTFFTSQSFTYWQTVYQTTRKIQGRINDFCMLLVLGAERDDSVEDKPDTTTKNSFDSSDPPNGVINGNHQFPSHDGISEECLMEISATTTASPINMTTIEQTVEPTTATTTATHTLPSKSNSYSQKGRDLVHTCSRLIRMSHIFFWAATPTASNGLSDSERFIADSANCPLPLDNQHIGPLLLSPYGLKALVKTGQLTKEEAQALNKTQLPPSQYAWTLLVWVGLHTMKGLRDGLLRGSDGLEQNLLQQLTLLRASMFDIDDLRAGRMPLAYVQLVQVLVDSLVILSPFALYPDLGIVSVPLVGIMTLFFRGLLTLSKSFLDPFGVEGFEEQNIRVDVLVSEINFGAAKRWSQAGMTLPNT